MTKCGTVIQHVAGLEVGDLKQSLIAGILYGVKDETNKIYLMKSI